MITIIVVPAVFSVVYLYHTVGWQISEKGECDIHPERVYHMLSTLIILGGTLFTVLESMDKYSKMRP